ncbi:hypothetical protein ABID39_000317 [Bartonella japonica]|uniref:Uncharacterized protein n=1 Tax=Bartonella japonica TaxID=357761 RepID=A0ABV2FMA7_9HYPH
MLPNFIHEGKIENHGAISFLIGIGSKVDTFHQIDKTMMLLYMATLGDNSGMMIQHIKATWESRNVEE